MNKHRIRKPFRYEYIKGKYSGLTKEEREWRVWEEMDQEDSGYNELVERMARYQAETKCDQNP
ncbi:MAG: hypothetical protein WKF84_13415 [Pyrinomonadaceae bacterium]